MDHHQEHPLHILCPWFLGILAKFMKKTEDHLEMVAPSQTSSHLSFISFPASLVSFFSSFLLLFFLFQLSCTCVSIFSFRPAFIFPTYSAMDNLCCLCAKPLSPTLPPLRSQLSPHSEHSDRGGADPTAPADFTSRSGYWLSPDFSGVSVSKCLLFCLS